MLEDVIDNAVRYAVLGKDVWGIHMPNNDMAPWRETGEVVLFAEGRPPRAGEYALIKHKSKKEGDHALQIVRRIVEYVPAMNHKQKAKIRVRQYQPAKDELIDQVDIEKMIRIIGNDELVLTGIS